LDEDFVRTIKLISILSPQFVESQMSTERNEGSVRHLVGSNEVPET
jgi:hypothetical protein